MCNPQASSSTYGVLESPSGTGVRENDRMARHPYPVWKNHVDVRSFGTNLLGYLVDPGSPDLEPNVEGWRGARGGACAGKDED